MVQFRTNFVSQEISASFWCNMGQERVYRVFLECIVLPKAECRRRSKKGGMESIRTHYTNRLEGSFGWIVFDHQRKIDFVDLDSLKTFKQGYHYFLYCKSFLANFSLRKLKLFQSDAESKYWNKQFLFHFVFIYFFLKKEFGFSRLLIIRKRP